MPRRGWGTVWRYCRAGGYPPYTHGKTSTSPPHIPTQRRNDLYLGHRRSTRGHLLVGRRLLSVTHGYPRVTENRLRTSGPAGFEPGSEARGLRRGQSRTGTAPEMRQRQFNAEFIISRRIETNYGKSNGGNCDDANRLRQPSADRQYGKPRITAEVSNSN